jgi:hypothetical protein
MQATDARRSSSGSTTVALFNASASARMTTHSLLNTGGGAIKRLRVSVGIGCLKVETPRLPLISLFRVLPFTFYIPFT